VRCGRWRSGECGRNISSWKGGYFISTAASGCNWPCPVLVQRHPQAGARTNTGCWMYLTSLVRSPEVLEALTVGRQTRHGHPISIEQVGLVGMSSFRL